MKAQEVQAAIMRVAKERCAPLWKSVKTIVQKRDNDPVSAGQDKPVESKDKIESSVRPSDDLIKMKEASNISKPAAPEPIAPPPAVTPTDQKKTDLAVPPPAPKKEKAPAKPRPSSTDNTKAAPPSGPVAVLTLDEHGEILSAAEACDEVFGCECAALPGENIRTLLKGGLDNDI